MHITLYTATGCTRCKIVKGFLSRKGVPFQEKDIKGEGKQEFQQFYREHRPSVVRGPEGIEFPIFFDERVIRQGLGAVLAYVQGGVGLDGFVRTGTLHGEWVDGLDVSGGDPTHFDDLLLVLRYLKENGMKLELKTRGQNADLLERLLTECLGNRVIMELTGTRAMYAREPGGEKVSMEVEKTIRLVSKSPEYRFQTTMAPVRREGDKWSYLTAEEIGDIASWLKAATGNDKQPYLLRLADSEGTAGEVRGSIEPMDQAHLFRCRSKARQFQVKTETETV
jgi:glutaredoxin